MSERPWGPSAEEILDAAASLLAREGVDATLDEALQAALAAFRSAALAGPTPRLPALAAIPGIVYAAITGDYRPALPLTGLAVLLFLGIDLLDDLMDGDETPYWRGRDAAQTLLIATALIAALPTVALRRIEAAPATAFDMQSIVANGLLKMASGQHQDLLSFGRFDMDPAEAQEIAGAKSGEMTAMLAELGATFAQAPPETREAYAAWGHAYGTADQIRSDCFDLLREPIGSDLAHGIMTFPLACLVEDDNPAQRERLLTMVRDARDEHSARERLRRALDERRVWHITEMTIGWYVAAAKEALERAGPLECAAGAMREMLEGLSLTPRNA